ncbi:MAG: Gfo/Idh/MocA family oxidoreductase [Pirellulales bacterium]|nr:Gfo/Idh/MocA family oxidoreductase [Pirellulales bacterium]
MNDPLNPVISRRTLLKNTGKIAAATAVAGMVVPYVHAAEDNTLQLALIGCGDRGTGAAADALSRENGPIKLVALADVFPVRLKNSCENLKKMFDPKVDVPPERQFIGFDAYQKAMDCLKPGDIAIFTTPPAFRWVHFTYAVQKGLHVFMEKPTTVDGPTTKRMIALGEEADKKNLKVAVGLMYRHCRGQEALKERIDRGEIGDLVAFRSCRMHGPIAGFIGPNPGGLSDLLYQVQKFHGFLWASGGAYSDFYIHQIDQCSWFKDAWPLKAVAVGGRHYRNNCIDQNFDVYSVEYTYPDGAVLYFQGRSISGCHDEMATYAYGTKGSAVILDPGPPAKTRTYKGNHFKKRELIWAYPDPKSNPYHSEWDDLIDAIRTDKPYNETRRGAEASLVSSMGRMSAHTGQVVTFEEMLNCPHEFAPDVDKLTMDSPAPLQAGPDGKYPVPQPGIVIDREY